MFRRGFPLFSAIDAEADEAVTILEILLPFAVLPLLLAREVRGGYTSGLKGGVMERSQQIAVAVAETKLYDVLALMQMRGKVAGAFKQKLARIASVYQDLAHREASRKGKNGGHTGPILILGGDAKLPRKEGIAVLDHVDEAYRIAGRGDGEVTAIGKDVVGDCLKSARIGLHAEVSEEIHTFDLGIEAKTVA